MHKRINYDVSTVSGKSYQNSISMPNVCDTMLPCTLSDAYVQNKVNVAIALFHFIAHHMSIIMHRRCLLQRERHTTKNDRRKLTQEIHHVIVDVIKTPPQSHNHHKTAFTTSHINKIAFIARFHYFQISSIVIIVIASCINQILKVLKFHAKVFFFLEVVREWQIYRNGKRS